MRSAYDLAVESTARLNSGSSHGLMKIGPAHRVHSERGLCPDAAGGRGPARKHTAKLRRYKLPYEPLPRPIGATLAYLDTCRRLGAIGAVWRSSRHHLVAIPHRADRCHRRGRRSGSPAWLRSGRCRNTTAPRGLHGDWRHAC